MTAMMIKARVDILPEAQKRLWPLLKEVPKDFVLYGGTAVALRYGHRQSVDFDFFSSVPDDDVWHHTKELSFIRKYAVNIEEPSFQRNKYGSQVIYDLDLGVDNTVEITFLRNENFIGGSVKRPDKAVDNGIQIASPIDLMATKINAILRRYSVKDFVDVAAMLENGVSFSRGFAAAMALKRNDLPELIHEYAFILDGLRSNEFYERVFAIDKDAPMCLKSKLSDVVNGITKEAENVSISDLLNMKININKNLHNYRGLEL